jgi:hypothetical protein
MLNTQYPNIVLPRSGRAFADRFCSSRPFSTASRAASLFRRGFTLLYAAVCDLLYRLSFAYIN